MNEVKVGSYTGTAATIQISLGFVPTYVRIWNETDGNESWEWFDGMPAGSALYSKNHASEQFAKILANGVSEFAGTEAGVAKGFAVGTAISADAKTFRYLALRAGPGAQV